MHDHPGTSHPQTETVCHTVNCRYFNCPPVLSSCTTLWFSSFFTGLINEDFHLIYRGLRITSRGCSMSANIHIDKICCMPIKDSKHLSTILLAHSFHPLYEYLSTFHSLPSASSKYRLISPSPNHGRKSNVPHLSRIPIRKETLKTLSYVQNFVTEKIYSRVNCLSACMSTA